MIERLVTLCFNRRGIVVLVFLFAALYGWHSWTQLPLEAYPDIADTTSQVVDDPRSWERALWEGLR